MSIRSLVDVNGVAYLAAAVLALIFVWAAAAKLARPASAETALQALAIPAPSLVARALPLAELVLAVALLSAPRAGGVLALAVLMAFSAVLARRIRAGVSAPCACFGAGGTHPVSFVELARNGLLAVLAVAALFAQEPVWPSPVAVAVVSLAVLAGASALQILRARTST